MTQRKQKPQPQPRHSLEVLTEKFIQRMQVQNFAASTIKMRREYLKRFFTWCDDRGITRIDEITRDVLLFAFGHRLFITRFTAPPVRTNRRKRR